MNWQRFMAVLVARNYEFLRDRSALGWNILLPVLIVFGFAFAFADEQLDRYKVGVINGKGEDAAFLQTRYVRFIPVDDLAQAITRVERHQLDMLLDMDNRHFWVNDTSANGYVLEQLLLATDSSHQKQVVTGSQVRYVDWLIPGVLGMNMMFSALYGVGYVIVRYRKNGVLKRLKATPLNALEFLSAQLISRWWLIMVISIAVYFGTHYFIGFSMHGSYLDLFLVFGLGAFSMICLGLIVAARLRSEELADGVLNLISWPMMFLSGVWFSLDGLHPWVQKLAMIFPLAHITEAARAIMIDGAGLGAIAIHLTILICMSLVFLILGALSFRWE
ncbi:MAG TPA: ABC transporter permease [Gammaproteobacteria bacterium]